jgi:hypothetical protein
VAERLVAELGGFFALDVAEEARRALRRASTTGRSLGAAAWIKALEKTIGGDLTQGLVGQPPKACDPANQEPIADFRLANDQSVIW